MRTASLAGSILGVLVASGWWLGVWLYVEAGALPPLFFVGIGVVQILTCVAMVWAAARLPLATVWLDCCMGLACAAFVAGHAAFSFTPAVGAPIAVLASLAAWALAAFGARGNPSAPPALS